jgi:DNA-directed RNA polymerase specialized sigma24 family protein
MIKWARGRSMAAQDLETLVERTIDGDEAAWRELWGAVEPTLQATVRRPSFLGRLAQNEDDCRNIVVEVMSRLRADDCGRLRQFLEARRLSPTLQFVAWLVVVAKRVAIDYLRAHDDYIDRRHEKDASRPGAWRDVGPLPSDSLLPGGRPQYTNQGAAHELLQFADAELPAEQRAALEAWLAGATFEEIAAGGDAREAEKLVRAALRRLRRQFRDGET